MTKITQSTNRNILIQFAGIIIIIAGMKEASSILIPFFLSIFITIIFAPPFLWLKSKKVPTILALFIVILGIILLGIILAVLIETSVTDFSKTLPIYKSRLSEFLKKTVLFTQNIGIKMPDQILLDYFDPGSLMGLVGKMLSGVGGILSNTLLIILTVIFMLLESIELPQKLVNSFKNPQKSVTQLKKFTENIKQYMIIKSIISLCTGIIISLWLFILGVDYPILWGLLAFLLNYVPTIGSIIAAVPAVLLTMIQLGMGSTLLVAIGYLAVNFIMGNIIEPRYMGKGLGLSTLVVFLSLIFWGWIFGAIGMLLSVPLTMVVKIALDSNPETKWLSNLISPMEPVSKNS